MTTTTELVPGNLDVTKLAVASFLARHREPTLTAYTQDVKALLGWCRRCEAVLLRVTQVSWSRICGTSRGRGSGSTIARRFGTVANF